MQLIWWVEVMFPLRNLKLFQIQPEHHLLWESLSLSPRPHSLYCSTYLSVLYFCTAPNIRLSLCPPRDVRTGLHFTQLGFVKPTGRHSWKTEEALRGADGEARAQLDLKQTPAGETTSRGSPVCPLVVLTPGC